MRFQTVLLASRALALSLIAALLVTFPLQGAAKDLPGANDPSFQNAVEEWLNGDGKAALTALNALAIEGNQAARLLLSSTRFYWWSREDIAQAGFRRRRKLFTDPNGSSWRKDPDAYDYPLDALEVLGRQQSAETWLKAAKTALAAGEREHVLTSFHAQSDEHPYLVEFLSEIVTLDDYEQADIWLTKKLGSVWRGAYERVGHPPSPKWDLNWKNDPWTAQDEAEFQAAFADARLAAITYQEYINTLANGSPKLAFKADLTHQRSAQILSRHWLRTLGEEGPPTPEETRVAGEILVS